MMRNPKSDFFKKRPKAGKAKKQEPETSQKPEQPEKTKDKILTHIEEEVRLNKYLARAGVCSRREADQLIAKGKVIVNGQVITEMGYKVLTTDQVECDGKKLNPEKLQYVLLNKPKDFITTTSDEHDRRTVMDLISKACDEKINPVGRLDRQTTGLLLFTNDGNLANKLTHPSGGIRKIYEVTLDRELEEEDLTKLKEGLSLEDGKAYVDEASILEENKVGLEIHIGKNRIVRRMFEHLKYDVIKLDRTVFAGLTKKDLPRGKYRHLKPNEINNLKMLTGQKKNKNT